MTDSTRAGALMTVSLVLLAACTEDGGGDAVTFRKYSEEAFQEGRRTGRPLLIKATAGW